MKESIEESMKDFLKKGEKAAFLTRDLIIKNHGVKKLLKEEKKLTNQKLITQGLKEMQKTTEKIYE